MEGTIAHRGMIYSLPIRRGNPSFLLLLLLICSLLLFGWWSELLLSRPDVGPERLYTTATGPSGLEFEYEVTLVDFSVEWDANSGGDFDPRDKCPRDFLSAGFILLSKKLEDGSAFNYLYHQGRRLLYRIDKDIIGGRAQIGLHWVTNTSFGAKYRIADPSFKGGKEVQVPDSRGGTHATRFQYGQPVSKRRTTYSRELFRPTHIEPDQCPEWWDLFNFIP